ncbi:hypothetical protein GUJ93_ZPchr0006g43882 [Zizania palustris]|uniref:Uncharacterized protein n=1 Tax=Zizania palustris TaxID=103762 RepID=A0A8J5SDA3_ZIZPA|nr:hypothetical protein GUJ93_ZPchr0006g43882 [Zizania palustris]
MLLRPSGSFPSPNSPPFTQRVCPVALTCGRILFVTSPERIRPVAGAALQFSPWRPSLYALSFYDRIASLLL